MKKKEKGKYNNYRDDHQIFRNLTTSAGKIEVDNEKVMVSLMPTMEYSKITRAIILHGGKYTKFI